jgi:hypothetical protein
LKSSALWHPLHCTPRALLKVFMTLRSFSGSSFSMGGSFFGSRPMAARSAVIWVAIVGFMTTGAFAGAADAEAEGAADADGAGAAEPEGAGMAEAEGTGGVAGGGTLPSHAAATNDAASESAKSADMVRDFMERRAFDSGVKCLISR